MVNTAVNTTVNTAVQALAPPRQVLRFLILIPQGNAAPLKARKRSLFAGGCPGAWSFPPVVPLALTARPFGRPELTSLAASLRHTSMADGRDGKIRLREPRLLDCPGLPGIFGPVLDLPPPALPQKGTLFPFPALVLAAALADPGDGELLQRTGDILSQGEPFSFSAAATANMILEPLPDGDKGYSFRWKIGELQWLPAPGKGKK